MRRALFTSFSLTLLLTLGACTRRIPETPFIALYSDDFNRSNQVLSATARWEVETPSAAVFNIVNNMAWPGRGSGAEPTALFYNPVGLPNAKATVEIYVSGGTLAFPYMRILARFDTNQVSTATNGYECGLDGTGNVTLIRNGITVASGDHTFNFSPGDHYSLSFAQIKNAIVCDLEQEDGEREVVGYNDENRWEGGHYFGLTGGESGGNYGYFDDFRVYGK